MPGFGGAHLCHKIIKPADTHARSKMASHSFPEFTTGQDTTGDVFLKKAATFKADVFLSGQGIAGHPRPSEELSGFDSGSPAETPTAEDENASVRPLLDQVRRTVAAMEKMIGNVEREMERAVGLLALGLAENMVNHTADSHPEVVMDSLARALKRGQGQEIRSIRLNPADIELVSVSKEYLSGLVDHFDGLRLEKDAALTRGGCVVETDCGTIDATPENQFRVLEKTFASVTVRRTSPAR